jgi:hypothetical protein
MVWWLMEGKSQVKLYFRKIFEAKKIPITYFLVGNWLPSGNKSFQRNQNTYSVASSQGFSKYTTLGSNVMLSSFLSWNDFSFHCITIQESFHYQSSLWNIFIVNSARKLQSSTSSMPSEEWKCENATFY